MTATVTVPDLARQLADAFEGATRQHDSSRYRRHQAVHAALTHIADGGGTA